MAVFLPSGRRTLNPPPGRPNKCSLNFELPLVTLLHAESAAAHPAKSLSGIGAYAECATRTAGRQGNALIQR